MTEGSDGRAATVLVVDDLPAVRRVFERTLSSSGFKVLEAGDGDAALHIARTAYPDVIILDLGLPKKAGFDVVRRLKADPLTAGIPFIVVTGSGDEGTRETALELGAAGFLAKPFSPLELLERIESALS